MSKSIKLPDAFINARNVTDLLEKLEEHKNNGVEYLTSYNSRAIEIQNLIDRIKLIARDTWDLDEIGKGIMSYISS